jgi:AraC family transcriptional regulator of adaptative response/methylated-DNA-[protein]-cysteine methyltransferase
VAASDYIRAHAEDTLPLAKLAARAGLSPWHFQRSFKAVLGVTPKQFQAAARLERLKTNLREGEGIAGAMFGAGFGSTSRVYEQVDGQLGMTPAAYRAGGAGETLHYAVRKTALGLLMMAATARGVCFVQFGTSETALKDQLAREYPKAKLVASEGSAGLNAWIDALEAHIRQAGPRPDLPLDLRGTAFQIRVWRFLLSVREGDAVSYSEVAQGIGAPKAVRAAASACAANRIAVLVPCHRVLRGDGGLGGYRWGVERKRALLDVERKRRAEA